MSFTTCTTPGALLRLGEWGKAKPGTPSAAGVSAS